MSENAIEYRSGDDVVTTDLARIPVDEGLSLLRTTYWARDISRETLARAMEHSLCFGLLRGCTLVGLARVVTDRATYAYLTDMVVAEAVRGQGLGRWLMACILEHPDLQELRRFTLLTSNAVALYEEFGFAPGAGGSTYMELRGGAKTRRARRAPPRR